MSAVPTIALIRETSLLTDALVRALVPALQMQVDRDWLPHWPGCGATVIFVPPGQMIPGDAWQLALLNTSDEAGALGYHDTTATGLPCGIVAVGDCIRDKLNWNVTVSHELLEMLGDPEITKVFTVEEDGITYEYAYEVCDAVEDDQFAYNVSGHMMSDFVLPSWFAAVEPAGPFGPFSFRDHLFSPLHLAPGGYIGRREIAPVAGDWSQVLAEEISARQVKGPTSRTIRRFNRA